MAKYVTSEKIKIKNARLSFVKIEKPEPFAPGQTPRYSLTVLLDPSNLEHAATIKEVKAKAEKITKETFKGVIPDGMKLCFGNGDSKAAVKPETYEAYKGMWYLSAHETAKPWVINRAAKVVAPGEPQFPYSGCYGNVNVTLWCYNGSFGQQVNANLLAVQFIKDGPAFGRGGSTPDEEFDAIEEDESAPSPFD